MGFLDKKERILDVVLTQKGRELLSKSQLNFSYYAFSDDGIDYSGSFDSMQPVLSANPTLIQSITSGSAGGASTVFTGTFASAPRSGSTLIAVMGIQGNGQSVSSISQVGATWSLIHHTGTSANGNNLDMWYAPNVQQNASNRFFINKSGGGQCVLQAAEYSGVISLDKSASLALDDGFPTGSTGITPVISSRYELVIAGMSSIANTLHSMSSPGFVEIGSLTGSGILNTSMFGKVTSQSGTQEAIFKFLGPFNPLDFTSSPSGVPAGIIATFITTTTASFKETQLDNYVHNNTFPFEAVTRKDQKFNSWLFTIPPKEDVVTEFKMSHTGSLSLQRKYIIASIESVVNSMQDVDKLKTEEVLDIVVTVDKVSEVKNQTDRDVQYVIEQLFRITDQELEIAFGKLGITRENFNRAPRREQILLLIQILRDINAAKIRPASEIRPGDLKLL